jgi:predicted ATPase with chaperone activity
MTTVTVDAESQNTVPEPVAPTSIGEAGVSADMIVQLLTKTLSFVGELSGLDLADRLGVPFSVIEPGIDRLKAQHACEIVGGSSLGAPSYRYRITQLGREMAGSFLDRNMYTGAMPVPLAQYREYMDTFRTAARRPLRRDDVKRAFSHLVLPERVLDQLGPAIIAGHSLFVYGPPGNGKTVIAQAIQKLMTEDFWVPQALDVDGSIIQVFDPVNHKPRPVEEAGAGLDSMSRHDRRWVRCQRPAVMVGGELTLDQLELTYNPNAGFYRAPLQLVANGGLLVIDDFGRQQCSPHAILNRWITPLESRVDFLTLQSGQKVAVPFMVLPVLATNIRPAELVDEAFLRRIHYKVFAEDPTPDAFRLIWRNYCRDREVDGDPDVVDDLLTRVLPRWKAKLRGCQPRDIIEQALSRAAYLGEPRYLTKALVEGACDTYFVDEQQGVSKN